MRRSRDGATGVIVTHGTDTMAYSAAAISFMIDTPVPIVFVGSQRSADRPSSDNAMNAVCAAAQQQAISGKWQSSCMRQQTMIPVPSTGAPGCARCTPPAAMRSGAWALTRSAYVEYPSRKVTLAKDAVRRGTRNLALHDKLEPHCALVQFFPGCPRTS